jgi:ribonuclease HI
VVTATCRSCGSRFEPDPQLLERFPGWTPRECPDCYRGGRRGARTGGRGRQTSLDTATPPPDTPTDGVFTDGSAVPNPGPGGWGAVWVRDDEVMARASGRDPETTNNRMELRALIEGARLVPEGTSAVLWSDSNLAVRTVNEWAAGWKRRGWKRRSGPVENLDLVRELYELVASRPELEVRWIKAHVGHRWNEYADRLAAGEDPEAG